MQKSVFVIGGTGVMGKFLVEKLLSRGVRVDAATLDDVKSEDAALRYYCLLYTSFMFLSSC